MNKYFTYSRFLALLLALGVSSCSSGGDEDEGHLFPGFKPEASFSLTIGSPKTYADVSEMEGTADETKFNTVDVFVFEPSNASTVLTHQTLTKSQFTETPAGSGVWKLNEKDLIVTESGKKNIYVGLNLPETMVDHLKTNGVSGEQEITALTELKGKCGIAMFSDEVVLKDLKMNEVNNINVSVSRLLAKAVFFDKLPEKTSLYGGQVKLLGFAVSNVNKKLFVLPKTDFQDPNYTLSLPTDFLHISQTPAVVDDYQPFNTDEDLLNARGVYMTENTSEFGAVQRHWTYGVIKAAYIPEKLASYEGAKLTETLNTKIKPTTFHLVKTINGNLYFENKNQAVSYALDSNGTEKSVLTYTNGEMYYSIFFNPKGEDGVSPFNVIRNRVYKVSLTAIRGLGHHTDLQGTGEYPGVIDPEITPSGADVNIAVEIEVGKWLMGSDQDEILEGNN